MRLRLFAALLTFAPELATAHAIDEVVQAAYLTLAPGIVRLELDVTPGTQVAGAVLSVLDADGDRRITDGEARAYAVRVLAAMSLTLDGAPGAWRLESTAFPPYASLATAGDTLKIYAIAARPARPGARDLAFENRYNPTTSQVTANIFVQPAGGWRYRVIGQNRSDDGRRFEATYSVER